MMIGENVRTTLFMKNNERNILFTNYHDKVCFLFNKTDSHISRLTANFVFQAFERRIIIANYTIQLYLYFLNSICLLLYFS